MSDFISEYGEQLRQAGWRRLHARRFAPLMRARPARKVVVALVVLCVAAPAVTATVVWHPLLGDGRSSAPTSSDAPAADSQRRVLSVLRRAQQPADRGAQTRYALKFLGASVAGVRTHDIRLLHVERDGRGIVLIPVGRYGLAPAGTPPALAERLGRREGVDGLCVFAADQDHGRPAGGGFGCYSTQQLLSGQAIAGLGDRVYGLAPDGIDKVEVALDDGRILATANVVQNFFIYDGALGRGDLRWLDDQGKIVKTIPAASDLPAPPPDRATSICDPAVPKDQCVSGLYVGPNGTQRGRPSGR
jgi:hypothetical protein